MGAPKGNVRKDEPTAKSALREVHEETGLEAKIVRRLPAIEYWFRWSHAGIPALHHKKVDLYLMRPMGGDLRNHDAEVVEAQWVSATEAFQRMSFKSEQEVLRAAIRAFESPRAKRVPGVTSKAKLPKR